MKYKEIIISVLTLTVARLFINMTRRFPYPFLPEISRQVSVPLNEVQNVMAVNAGVGIASPLFGPLSERYGRKKVMMGALAWIGIAGVFGAAAPSFWVFAATMIAFGIGKMIFDPAMQAYIGDRVPYQRRALAIGTTELSWALSLIVIAPIAGFLLGNFGLQAVLLVLAGLSVIALILVALLLPPDAATHSVSTLVTPLSAWPILRRNPAALGALLYSLLLVMANEIFFINYGVWMESTFDLDLVALGGVSGVIALAEVIGEFAVIGLADRFGKRRLALIGASIAAITYLALPQLSFSLAAALVGLFILFLFIEIAIVSSVAFFTEVLPDARSVMMSSNVGAHSSGRLLGALIGGQLYGLTGSIPLIGLVATLIGLGAFGMMWRYVHE